MNTILKRTTAVIATGAILLNTFATSALASTTIEISGNGYDSKNEAEVKQSNETTVVQNNYANIDNKVEVKADTGNNSASKNTGGDVLVTTGDATVDVTIENMANQNSAEVENCNCESDTNVLIKGNGADSKNDAEVKKYNDVSVYQDNKAYIDNNVDVNAKTGANRTDKNTGGDVKVYTGDANTTVDLSTAANVNSARVSGNGDSGEVSAMIVGNGADSRNDIELKFDNDLLIAQDNKADVDNRVDVYAQTGANDANKNTGGDVLIYTGDATADISVDNMVNFNAADADCGCVLDVLAKVHGNGADSKNDIEARFDEDTEAYQDNKAYLDNDVKDIFLKTGYNDADKNVGEVGSDPAILTGDATGTVDVSNTSNVNTFGDADFELPDFHFDFSFDMSDLMGWLSSHN